MKKLNTKGFALVETLIVSVFVMGIFTLLYTNFYPLIGEYEKREGYDTISGVYKTDIIKRFFSNSGIQFSAIKGKLNSPGGNENAQSLNCDNAAAANDPKKECNQIITELDVDKLYISRYQCKINLNAISDEGLKEYIKYKGLNDASNISNSYNYDYRIIVKYKKTVNEGTSSSEDIYEYATLGVDLK